MAGGKRSTPFFDTEGSVHRLRFQQHGLRSPASSFEQATSIRFLRVSELFVDRIQRTHSQRAIGVIRCQRLHACGADARALLRSAGTSGSIHSLTGLMDRGNVSPAAALMALSMVLSTLNQWLPIPSGSSGVRKLKLLTVPSTNCLTSGWKLRAC